MDTGLIWLIPTLADALVEDPTLAEGISQIQPIAGSNKTKYLCSCKVWAWSWQLQDVRAITTIPENWICCGCFSKLERELANISGNGNPHSRRKFNQQYLALHNAPQILIDNVGKRYDGVGEYIMLQINKRRHRYDLPTISYEGIEVLSGITGGVTVATNLETGVDIVLTAGSSIDISEEIKITVQYPK